ncbi:phage head closure protein [Brevibacillus reuszeri]|uniref:phage head closure protein n=1 Tax=Brevibacillus reuszeri TaxID=54915 RepID=UPI00366A79C9
MKKQRTFDHELTLILPGGYEEDAIGNQIPTDPIETTVLCCLDSVGRTEFYNAAANGLRPELLLVIHAFEYNGERKVMFQGVTYNVIRTYEADFEELELTCERIAADG